MVKPIVINLLDIGLQYNTIGDKGNKAVTQMGSYRLPVFCRRAQAHVAGTHEFNEWNTTTELRDFP
jgi:hypothetical protein